MSTPLLHRRGNRQQESPIQNIPTVLPHLTSPSHHCFPRTPFLIPKHLRVILDTASPLALNPIMISLMNLALSLGSKFSCHHSHGHCHGANLTPNEDNNLPLDFPTSTMDFFCSFCSSSATACFLKHILGLMIQLLANIMWFP